MAVKIQNIQIEKLGPLESIQYDLGLMNLIFGHNESGKTYLVEFLLQSIFRHAKNWGLREFNTQGYVNIEGLKDEPTVFSPTSSRKIEDYWDEENSGLPLNMARLLVVKGGELNLADGYPGGVSRDVLKHALTGQALLDQIRERIQPTVRNAEIVDHRIIGRNQGQIRELNKLREELQDQSSLLDDIEKKYSRAPARQIEIDIDSINRELDQQQKAKKHHAYILARSHQDLLEQKKGLSDDTILDLRDRVRDYKKLSERINDLRKMISDAQNDLELYHWLESAYGIWTEKELDNKVLPNRLLGILGGSFLLIGLGVIIAQYSLARQDLIWPGLITSITGVGLLALFAIQAYRWSLSIDDTAEKEAIRKSFKDKFAQQLMSAADLKAQINNLQENYNKISASREELGKLEIQQDADKKRINELFLDIREKKVNVNDWDSYLDQLKKKSDSLDIKINDLVLEITKLNLEEKDYLADPQKTEYDSLVVKELEQARGELLLRLNSYQSNLETLKARACEWTRDEISSPWRDVLNNLRQRRLNTERSLNELTAELVAKIGLSQILDLIEQEEDNKILENINSGEISTLLVNLTGKYQKLDLVEDQIIVKDAYQEYPLRDLSTGAREQVQLALRLGIATRVSGGEPLFIILDDAFQHSDWDRRESLVQETVNLSQQGWQIIYLTMDDHIRDLYHEIAKPILKRQFVYHELD